MLVLAGVLASVWTATGNVKATQPGTATTTSRDQIPIEDAEVRRIFRQSHEGYSSDEVLVRGDLRRRWLTAAAAVLGRCVTDQEQTALWRRLLNLRKSGRLDVPTTRRGRPPPETVMVPAEMAARVVMDRHHVTSDELLIRSDLRRELIGEARLIDPRIVSQIDGDNVAKAVLNLRKRRVLRPELVLTVADWDRSVQTFDLQQLRRELSDGNISDGPGVYLFRQSDGYLYIGEAANLSRRLDEHLTHSDRFRLAEHLMGSSEDVSVELHWFAKGSPARKTKFRRAYESELIRSRHPRFNVRP